MVWMTNERLTRGNEIPKKSCRPLQGSRPAAGGGAFLGCRVVVLQGAFSRDIVVRAKEVVGEIGLEEEGGRKIREEEKSFCLVV